MRRLTGLVHAAAASAVLLAAGCGSSGVVERPVTAPPPARELPQPPPPPPAAAPQADPIGDVIAQSQRLFDRGQQEAGLGHLAQARVLFDQALDSLLELPEGARSNARLKEHFDRLVDRISAYELRALAEGDGFSERPTVPASIDELLDLATFDLPAPPPSLREAVESDLESTAHDVPIPLNPKVLAYVDLFQGRLRDWFQSSLQRSAPYLPMIQERLKAEGLPLDLAFVPIVESAFRTDALSRAKAKGFWQLMRGTAVEQGLKYDWYIDERSNPEKSTEAAVKYLKRLHRMFDGDWHLALASYNGGPGKVQRAVKRKGGEADFWPLSATTRYLPRETREYVPMVLASMVIARNPERYGFTFTPADLAPTDTVTLPGPVDLRRVSEWAGVPVDQIQRLNPELRRWTTPLRGTSFPLTVPAGTGPLVEQRLAELPAEEFTALNWHTVRKGETLQSVANKLKVRRADLAEANYLSAKARVKPGQRLVIPRAPTTLLAAQADRPEPAVAKARPAAPAPTSAPAATPSGDLERITYRVKRGDTLSSIARVFQTSVASLRTWNGLKHDRLVPGDKLTVYTKRSASQ
ncbi:MAG: LysM peptidoglycan-binding domain-containing protein [Vicinamibacterales bacterium]|jgi:membrane-bound lytic murein transglycosylase D|nr:LysM peptidoglycan-binding domain-containing protein [Vicinamibacterales bacterium]